MSASPHDAFELPRQSMSNGMQVGISDREFNALRTLIYAASGISLSATRRALVCSRLSRRLRELQLQSFSDYHELVVSEGPDSEEYQLMINCITTNMTSFFRENHHFDHLRNKVLPALRERVRAGHPRRLRVWSAGCSTGEEPYSIAMACLNFWGTTAAQWDLRILASDIDTEVLARADAGRYPADQLENIPQDQLQTHFLRGRGDWAGFCQVRPEVRQLVAFRQLNLIEDPWPIRTQFDLIFCRNVLIYFDHPTKNRIISRLADTLTEDGTLFLGHSESAETTTTGLMSLGNTTYRRRAAAGAAAVTPVPALKPADT